MTMFRSRPNRFEIVHIPHGPGDAQSLQRTHRSAAGSSLPTGWYLLIRPARPGRRNDRPAEFLGPFDTGSEAGAAIAAIDAQFASHA
jgi:hypothetical protein